MNSKMTKFFTLTFLILISSNSYSVPGWSGIAKVTSIYHVNESQVVVKLSNFSNPHNCAITGDGDIILDPTNQTSMFSMLLSAYMGARDVQIYVDTICTSIWTGTSFAKAAHARLL